MLGLADLINEAKVCRKIIVLFRADRVALCIYGPSNDIVGSSDSTTVLAS
jgi:hypothetical protein